MNTPHLRERKRNELLARCAIERHELLARARALQEMASPATMARHAAQAVTKQPGLWVTAATALIVAVRRGTLGSWIGAAALTLPLIVRYLRPARTPTASAPQD